MNTVCIKTRFTVPTDFFSPLVVKISVPGSISVDNVYHTEGFWPRCQSAKVNFQVNKKICQSVYTLHKIVHDWPMCIVNRIFESTRNCTKQEKSKSKVKTRLFISIKTVKVKTCHIHSTLLHFICKEFRQKSTSSNNSFKQDTQY